MPPAAAVGLTTTLITEEPPLAAMLPPPKLQVMVPAALPQIQLMPVAETNVIFAGSTSLIWAVEAANKPELVMVNV